MSVTTQRRRLKLVLTAALLPLLAPASGIAQGQARGTWSAVSTMPSGTGDSGVAALDGKIYVIGGASFFPHILPGSSDMGSGTWGSTVNYEYDPATDKWRERAPLPIGLSHSGVIGFNHKLYVFGGFTSLIHANAQDVALAFDPATNTWQRLAPLSSPRGSPGVAEVDGKIHVFGGRPKDPTPLALHEAYDPATNRWTKLAPMPIARDHMGVLVLDGKIHIIGGRTNTPLDNTPEHDVYDPRTDKWSQAAPIPTPRSGGAAVNYAGLLIYAGGECKKRDPNAPFGGGEDFNEVQAYDAKTDSWRSLIDLPSGRQAFGAASVGGAAYFPGGTLRCGGLALTDQMLVLRLN